MSAVGKGRHAFDGIEEFYNDSVCGIRIVRRNIAADFVYSSTSP